LSNEKILIVEDEGIVILHIKKALENLGYVVAGMASSGDDAIIKATEIRPDLVLMDIVLKGAVDGIEVAEKIRAIRHIPVIYLTAHADESTLQRAKVTEPLGYIVKPFRERDLQIAIEFALYKSKMEDERNKLISKLENALEKVKQLSGLIPICASCKKIRDDKGYWEEVESYITKHSEALFSHGLCPTCAKKVLQEFEELKKDNR
jgi:two-component system, response regulator PdtaR